MKRLIAWACTLCMLLGCMVLPINASAYSKAYSLPTLTGNQAQDTANIALSQVGYSGSGGTVYGAWWNTVTNWGVDYTNSMWCAMFACWCANQAGAGYGISYDKNAAAVPNLLSWLEKNATVDRSYSMIPKAGDFIFFSGHVGIVTGYNSSTKTISFVAGNEGYSPGYVGKGTCGWWSGAKYGGQAVVAIGRPNYKNISPVVPAKTTPYTDSSTYSAGSSIKIKWNSVSDATYYWINIYRDGKQIISKDIGNTSSYTLSPAEPGSYEVCIEALNSAGTSGAKSCYFKVSPAKTAPYTDSSTYTTGSSIKIKWNAVSGASSYWINIYKDKKQIVSKDIGNTSSYTLSSAEPGSYEVCIEALNSAGSSGAKSCYFKVSPAKTAPYTDSSTYTTGSSIKIKWNAVSGASSYWINIYKDKKQIVSKDIGNTSSYTLSSAEPGSYEVCIEALNSAGSSGAASCYFTVKTVADDAGSTDSTSTEFHFPRVSTYTQGQFTDVPPAQWFTSNVANAVEFGLMKGNSATTFNPYGDVTLAEAITMAARIHAIYTTGTESFDQTSGGKWYQVYLDYAYENGIIDNSYYTCDVTKKATRAQYAEIFANSLPDKGLEARNQVADNAIPDVPMSQSYADSVYKLYRAGILTGGDVLGTFSPKTYITRAESATIVARMADTDNRMSFTLT